MVGLAPGTAKVVWPKERTALLVIHGVGEQSTFDTLDVFARGLLDSLIQHNPGQAIELYHGLRAQSLPRSPPQADDWANNYVSLVKGGDRGTAIDCFEYYWAHLAERQADYGDVIDWLIETGEAAQKYYDENEALVAAYEGQRSTPFGRLPFPGSELRFDKYWYLKYAGTGLAILRPLIGLAGAATTLPYGNLVKGALGAIAKLTKPFVVGAVGDVVIYTTTDMKSKHFEARKRILDGATDMIAWLLQSKDPEYGRVVVAGHSLGSVIAYDALNRINNSMNVGSINPALAKKLTGLATFGSPLDKIAFFFRARGSDEQYIKQQVIAQYVGFKTKNLRPGWTPPHEVHSEIALLLDHVRWLNFWDRKDPVSGPLDFYDIAPGDNRELRLGMPWGKAHSGYWHSDEMFVQMVRELLA